MVRQQYIDFIKKSMSSEGLPWFLKRATQYFLIHLSFLRKKPLCGPIFATLVTNYTCNFRCVMCDVPSRGRILRDRGLKELSTEQIKGVLKDFRALGVSGVAFTGGEPFLRKDIFDLLKYSKKLRLFTHISTNGSVFNDENVRKTLETGVDSINISLDGACKETHDQIRGFPGAFDKAIGAIERIHRMRKDKNIPVRLKIVSVINERNIDEIPDLINLRSKLNADSIEFIPQQPFSSAEMISRTCANPDFLVKVRKYSKLLLDLKNKGGKIENSSGHLALFSKAFADERIPFNCYAGYNSMAVDCFGEIYPCVPWYNWDKGVGNIAHQGLKEFWYSRAYDKSRSDILKCHGCYLTCQSELNMLFDPRK
jgi:MoaA/NifB/PqqE/SkfB family radical SAM enzyme